MRKLVKAAGALAVMIVLAGFVVFVLALIWSACSMRF